MHAGRARPAMMTGPCTSRPTVPKNLGADLSQTFDGRLLAFALRQQVDRGFKAQIVQCQLCTRRINPVKPIQKGLCWFNSNCGTVDRLHTVWSLKLPCGGSSSTTLPNARGAGWLRDSRDVGGPA